MEKNWFPLGGATHLPTVSFVNSWLNCTCCVWINCSVLLFLFILPDSSTGSDSVSIKCIDRSARSFACIYLTLRSPRRPCWRWRPTRTRPRRGRRSPATWVRSLMCSILEDRWDPAGWWCETQVMRPPACTASNRPNTRRKNKPQGAEMWAKEHINPYLYQRFWHPKVVLPVNASAGARLCVCMHIKRYFFKTSRPAASEEPQLSTCRERLTLHTGDFWQSLLFITYRIPKKSCSQILVSSPPFLICN